MNFFLIVLLTFGSASAFSEVGNCDNSINKLIEKAKSLQISESLEATYSGRYDRSSINTWQSYKEDAIEKRSELLIIVESVKTNCAN